MAPVIPFEKLWKFEASDWTAAKEFEEKFFKKSEGTQACDLPEHITFERMTLLSEVNSTGLLCLSTLSRLAAAVDYVLVTDHRLMTVKDAFKAGMAAMTHAVDMDAVLEELGWQFEVETTVRYEELEPTLKDLKSFATGRIYGVKDWLHYMFSLMRDEGRYYTLHDLKRLDELLLAVTLAGTTAHLPPSMVAAAILIYQFEEKEVKDYIAGYTTSDLHWPIHALIMANHNCVIAHAVRTGCPIGRARRRL